MSKTLACEPNRVIQQRDRGDLEYPIFSSHGKSYKCVLRRKHISLKQKNVLPLTYSYGSLSATSWVPSNSTNLKGRHLTWRVLHTKSLLSSPQTLCAATTNTSTRNTNTMDSQILPNAVEYLLTPLSRLSSPDQFIPAAAPAWVTKTSAPFEREEDRK